MVRILMSSLLHLRKIIFYRLFIVLNEIKPTDFTVVQKSVSRW